MSQKRDQDGESERSGKRPPGRSRESAKKRPKREAARAPTAPNDTPVAAARPARVRAVDRARVRTTSARARASRVRVDDEARPLPTGASLAEFVTALPRQLAGEDFRAVVRAWARAWSTDRTVLFGFGAHLVKVGLAPIVIDLMERGAINALMMNGAGCVHDLELSMLGHTSEDVAAGLEDGSFGMAAETAGRLNAAIARAHAEGRGMGEAIGADILASGDRHRDRSVLAAAARLGVPVTVHVAVGTDIHHMHPGADGSALGATSHRDFETLTGIVAGLSRGVVFNVGSAVILPEVFLKALALARNLGHRPRGFSTVNLDFIRAYRPETNVVDRPTRGSGRGYSLIGHHELMLPLLAAAVKETHAGRLEP